MLLLRHASAGERLSTWEADRARALDRSGRADARALVGAVARHRIERIVSSPHARCVETVEPLARSLDLEIELREELAPDRSLSEVLSVLNALPEASLVCTHREVIERVFDGEVTCEKGGTWLLEADGGRLVPSAYLPPPSNAIPQRRLRKTTVR
jgi:8-oxo-(d)GTP phosphatase